MQGVNQHHCVGSYCDLVEQGKYLVYDIQENDETVSTLGIYVNINMQAKTNKINKSFSFSQHYKACNQRVEKDLEEFAKDIIKELNVHEVSKIY